jgi:hypothetical protein
MRRFPGLRLGGLRLFAPGDAAFSDPETQVHRDLVVFGRSGKDLLHAYGKSGRCYVLPREAAQKGKVRQARLTAPDFVGYLRAVLPAAIAAQRKRAAAAVPETPSVSVLAATTSETPASAPQTSTTETGPGPLPAPPPAADADPGARPDARSVRTEPAPGSAASSAQAALRSVEMPSSAVAMLAEHADVGLDPDLAAAIAAPGESAAASKPPAPSAEARRQRSEAMLARWRLPPPPLPAGMADEEAVLRPAGAVAWRALCLMTVLAWASGFSLADEARAVGVPDEKVQQVFGQEIARRLTMRERMFLAADPPPEQECEAMGLKAESLAVLLRALGILKRLPMPNEDVDPALVFSLGFQVLVQAGQRPPLAITEAMALDLRDFYQRLHWIQRMAQLRGQKSPAGLRGEVLRERRHAIEWLVSSYETGFVDWDRVDISLPLPVA